MKRSTPTSGARDAIGMEPSFAYEIAEAPRVLGLSLGIEDSGVPPRQRHAGPMCGQLTTGAFRLTVLWEPLSTSREKIILHQCVK